MQKNDTPLADEFDKLCENPEGDWSFAEQREQSGFANFGVTPEKAESLRNQDKELIENAFQQGLAAFNDSMLTKNPYDWETQKALHISFHNGFVQGYENLVYESEE